jgi:hypothetical protein
MSIANPQRLNALPGKAHAILSLDRSGKQLGDRRGLLGQILLRIWQLKAARLDRPLQAKQQAAHIDYWR